MSALQKATLSELPPSGTPAPPAPAPGAKEPGAIDVQFNPTSLRLTFTNNVNGGKTQTHQAEQTVGQGFGTFALDLIFDTADEGTTDNPVSVRTRTADVRKFVTPKPGAAKEAPPRVRFHWGDLIVDGIMTSVTEDVDLFAASGVPLRAKVSISIQVQDQRFESLASGPGAATGAGATLPGGIALGASAGLSLGVSASASLGLSAGASIGFGAGVSAGIGLSADAQIGVALGGETAAGFAARAGLDPAAWRTLDLGSSSNLAIGAGSEVAFSPSAGASGGLGSAAGAQAGQGSSLAGALGLPAAPAPAPGGVAVPAPPQPSFSPQAPSPVPGGAQGALAAAGYALAAAGGVATASERAGAARSSAGAGAERAAFTGAASGPARVAAAASVVPSPHPDLRAVSFGESVPLRPQRQLPSTGVATPANLSPEALPPSAPEPGAAPGVAPWLQLPASNPGASTADAAQALRSPLRPCGCGGSRMSPASSSCGCGCAGGAR